MCWMLFEHDPGMRLGKKMASGLKVNPSLGLPRALLDGHPPSPTSWSNFPLGYARVEHVRAPIIFKHLFQALFLPRPFMRLHSGVMEC